MKKVILLPVMLFISSIMYSQVHLKKDGTPDMRYKENKQIYGNYNYQTPTQSYSIPTHEQPKEREYNNGGQLYYQNGYLKSNGTYVDPHLKTKPDNSEWNNYNNLYNNSNSDNE